MADRTRSAAKDTPGSVSRFDGGVALSGISYDKDLYSEDKSQYLETALTGSPLLSEPFLKGGTAFSEEDRQIFGLVGLLPSKGQRM